MAESGSLAPAEPYVTSFEATVERVVDGTAVLDRTHFYPEGGGQPSDRGTVDGVAVTDVREGEDGIGHVVADATGIEAGATVNCRVDPAFRSYCMRAHTASHVLYGAGRRLFDELGYGGFGISAEKVRVDLATPDGIDDDALVALEELTNAAVWDSRPVTWEQRPRGEALSDESVAFNAKTEEGIAGDAVRVVTVGPPDEEGPADYRPGDSGRDGAGDPGRSDAAVWDEAACGGTHVGNAREIGPVTVLGRSNPGEGLTRIEFAVGRRGIERRGVKKRAAIEAARRAGVAVTDLPDEIDRLRDERARLESEREDLEAALAEARVAALPTTERGGATWLVGRVDLDANALADRVRELADERADVVALVNDGSLAVGTTGDPDASDVVADVTDRFGGGGGGSPTVAQGGGLDADPADVVAFLRGEG
jgi:alanyl-tRNA synthetase